MKNMSIQQRLAALREYMQKADLQAFIIPSSDVHQSEYPAEHWQSRQWISGFTGSAGTVVVTLSDAGLWTDSRYFLQAENELQDSTIRLFKSGLPDTPGIAQWLTSCLPQGAVVGVDGNVYSAREMQNLQAELQVAGLQVNVACEPFGEIWTDRPPIPENPVFVLPDASVGLSVAEKIEAVNERLSHLGADALLIASLDTVAWLFNMRGNDVAYNPVFVAFAYVSKSESVLFIHPKKINSDQIRHLQTEGVTVAHYDKVYEFVSRLSGQRICVPSDKVSYTLYQAVATKNTIVQAISPADMLKATKNETELNGIRSAMRKDGVALVRFFRWLEQAVPQGNVTEHTIAEKLVEYRSEQPQFVGESFGTIAGYMANGAIVHYHAHPHTAATICPDGLLLVDSGAQYIDGTTDVTRTVAVGTVSDEMKQDYTLVLKGHIALARASFPEGTRGAQLDVLARQYLWQNGANYLHGTGHGIGHFLNVHEGPQSIRAEENPVALQVGMVLSNEPGVYRAGQYGIRLENLIAVATKGEPTEFGQFLHFETLTLCPFDLTPLNSSLLTEEEKDWLNAYHEVVYRELAPLLLPDEVEWLKLKTTPIK